MLADQLDARPLGRPNFAQVPQERTSTELIEFIAKRLVHHESLPAHRTFCHRDRACFPGSARVSRALSAGNCGLAARAPNVRAKDPRKAAKRRRSRPRIWYHPGPL